MTGRRGRLVRKNGVLKYDLRPENEETRFEEYISPSHVQYIWHICTTVCAISPEMLHLGNDT